MGAIAQAKGDLARAETLLREALGGQRQAYGDDDTDTLTKIERLSQVLRERGALDEATALEQKIEKIYTARTEC